MFRCAESASSIPRRKPSTSRVPRGVPSASPAVTGARAWRRPRRGFTYLEAAVSSVILGLGVATALNLHGSYVRGARTEQETQMAMELAADLMSEILDREFEDPEESTGGFGKSVTELVRSDFDDVDDYHGWSESPPQNPDGSTLGSGEYQDYRRTVRVWNVLLSDLETLAANGSTPAKAIEIKVKCGDAVRATLLAHRTRNSGAGSTTSAESSGGAAAGGNGGNGGNGGSGSLSTFSKKSGK